MSEQISDNTVVAPEAPGPPRMLETLDATPGRAPMSPSSHDLPWRDPLDRYANLGLLGKGGMGEVYRVRDSRLNRIVAMKIIHIEGDEARARFIEEAQITSQLQHPSIIPVYDLGILVDGRPFFTMKEIAGKNFSVVIANAHQPGVDQSALLPRLIGDLLRLCEGVAFAHKLGVLHRDLKPSNMMIGDFGEVLVVDWGLTRYSTASQSPEESPSHAGDFSTRFGAVIGTPSFMPPEQAAGDLDRIGPHSDVYSLGAVLYNILDGRPPYSDIISRELLSVLEGPPTPLGRRASAGENGPPIPPELKALCERAMAREPGDRYQNAGEFATVLAAWLEGAQRRERALRVLADARELKPAIARQRQDAAKLEAEATAKLATVPPFAPVAQKIDLWDLQDKAAALRNEAQLAEIRYTQLARAALTHAGDLEAADEMLAEYYHDQHAKAELARDPDATAQFEILLRDHDHSRYADYLKGEGKLSILTDPPGAAAVLYRYEEQHRVLVPVFYADLGTTPICEYILPMGSYVVQLSHPGRQNVTYPVFIERQRQWDGVRPGTDLSHPVYLPATGELGPQDCYVPPGWFWSGGDAQARNVLPAQRLWLDGFVMRRFHVTVADYMEFLNDLVRQGREEEAAAHTPPTHEWEKKDATSSLKDVGVEKDASGKYIFTGSEEQLRWPQALVNWTSAKAYADWLSARENLPWRLPTEMEYEKAARGADGRFFPWGNFLDPTFCCMRLSHTDKRALRVSVDLFPMNESPYGVRGLSGNVYSWCEDSFNPKGPTVIDGIPYPPDPAKLTGPGAGGGHRIVRGGSWRDPEWNCRAAFRDSPPAHLRDSILGFRVLRTFPVGPAASPTAAT